MKLSFNIATFLCVFLIAVLANAQGRPNSQEVINVDFGDGSYTQGEPFNVVITITAPGKSDPQIQVPSFAGFRILRQSVSQPSGFSFSVSFGSGGRQQVLKESHSKTYSYVLVADNPGEYKINPVQVTQDGNLYKGKMHTIKIEPKSTVYTNSLIGAVGQAPSGNLASVVGADTIDDAQVDSDYFLQLEVSKNECIVGEMVELTVYLYTTWSLRGPHLSREPGTEGFWVETFEDIDASNLKRKQVEINNTIYERVALKKLALFPIKHGDLTIDSAIVSFAVRTGGFFGSSKMVNRSSKPVAIKVLPLPKEGQPGNFNPANVGMFRFGLVADNTDVSVGQPITLNMSVRGNGNLRNIVLPKFADIDNFKVYAPENDVVVRAKNRSVTGKSSSKILIIPKKAGKFEIPQVAWSYYDPKKKKYVETKSKVIKINVKAGDQNIAADLPLAKSQTQNNENSEERMNKKLRSIVSRANLNLGDNIIMSTPWFISIVIALPVGFLLLILFFRARKNIKDTKLQGRSKRAAGIAKRSLVELGKEISSLSSDNFFGRLQKTVIQFLESRLEENVAGDTMSELSVRLIRRGYSEELAQQTVAEMENCEFSRFAKNTEGKDERQMGLSRSLKLIDNLAKTKVTAKTEAK